MDFYLRAKKKRNGGDWAKFDGFGHGENRLLSGAKWNGKINIKSGEGMDIHSAYGLYISRTILICVNFSLSS